jgi:hypothetical protein
MLLYKNIKKLWSTDGLNNNSVKEINRIFNNYLTFIFFILKKCFL